MANETVATSATETTLTFADQASLVLSNIAEFGTGLLQAVQGNPLFTITAGAAAACALASRWSPILAGLLFVPLGTEAAMQYSNNSAYQTIQAAVEGLQAQSMTLDQLVRTDDVQSLAWSGLGAIGAYLVIFALMSVLPRRKKATAAPAQVAETAAPEAPTADVAAPAEG